MFEQSDKRTNSSLDNGANDESNCINGKQRLQKKKTKIRKIIDSDPILARWLEKKCEPGESENSKIKLREWQENIFFEFLVGVRFRL